MSTFQKAAERARKMGDTDGSPSNESVSSGIGAQMTIARDLQKDSDGTAITSEIAQEDLKDYLGGLMVLPREAYNEVARMHNQEAVEIGHLSQIVFMVHGGSSMDEGGNLIHKQEWVYTIRSDRQSLRAGERGRSRSVDSVESSRLSSLPPTMSYG